MNRIAICLIALCATLTLSCAAVRAEEPAPKAPDAPKTPDKAQAGGRTGGRGNWTPGGGGFDPMAMMGGRGTGSNNVMGMISRMLGIDIEDPKAAPKLDQLPLGVSKRMVTQIPVGGVDNFIPTGNGWKMETIFKLTPDQTKATDALRDEYAAEQKKLDQEIKDAEAALAVKVTDLRAKYEKKANDLLTGADKDSKEKMDALAAEVNKKNAAWVADALPLYDTKDFQQGIAMVRAIREKITATTKDAEDKLLTYIPDENRPKFQELLKSQADMRTRMTQMGNTIGGNGGGFQRRGQGGAGGDGGATKPPKAPEGDKF